MPKEVRDHLLKEIEEIRTIIDNLQPQSYGELTLRDASDSSRARLATLRKVLAHDMELLHTAG